MLNENTLFFLFSIFLVISAFMVIIANHSVFSLLFLVSSFIFAAFLLLLLECEFLALLFILVYVGAIAIFFLFAIMMLDSKFNDLSKNKMKYVPVGFVFAIILLLPVLNDIKNKFTGNGFYNTFLLNKFQNWYDLADSITDVEVCGQVLYTYFVLQLLIAGLILLLVLVGVVYLTNNCSTNKQILEQSVFKQLSREFGFFSEKNN